MGKEVSNFQSAAAKRHASRRTEHTINSQDVTRYGNILLLIGLNITAKLFKNSNYHQKLDSVQWFILWILEMPNYLAKYPSDFKKRNDNHDKQREQLWEHNSH